MKPQASRSVWLRLAAAISTVFGVLTIREGGAVLFFDGTAREAAGHLVPFVLWFNFLAGFFYIVAALGIWFRQTWAAYVALAIAVSTLLVFAAFALHVMNGGAYEIRTVVAMTFRSAFWLAIAATLLLTQTAGTTGSVNN